MGRPKAGPEGSRLRMTGLAVHTMDLLVNIDVDDLPKAIAFYEQAAGLRPARRFGALGVEMLGASSPVYLLVKQAGTSPSPRADDKRHYRRHWTPVHLDFVVADVAAAIARASEAGATIEGEVEIGNEIPIELYKAVAEVLPFLMRMSGVRPGQKAAPTPAAGQGATQTRTRTQGPAQPAAQALMGPRR